MAIILKRERKTQATHRLKLKQNLLGGSILFVFVAMATGAAISFGFLADHANPVFKDTSSLNKESSQKKQIEKNKQLYEEASSIWAALSRYSLNNFQNEPLESLSQLSPGLIPSEQGESPEYLSLWQEHEGYVVRTITKEQCLSLSSEKKISPFLSGASGLSCVQVGDQYLGAYLYSSNELRNPVNVGVELTGQRKGGITGWSASLVQNPSHCDKTLLDGTYQETLHLGGESPEFKRTICIPSFLGEVREVAEGLSFTQGSQSLWLQGQGQGTPWELQMRGSSCDLGAKSVTQISLGYGTSTQFAITPLCGEDSVTLPKEPYFIAPDLEYLLKDLPQVPKKSQKR